MANFINGFANAIKSKIVAKRVEKYLNSIDEDIIEESFDRYSDVLNHSVSILKSVITTTITKSRPTIVKLAEKNSNELIEIVDLLTKLGDVIDRVTTDENKEIVKTLGKDIYKSVEDKVNSVAFEQTLNAYVESAGDVAAMFMNKPIEEKRPKFFIFNATKEYMEVSEEEFLAHEQFMLDRTGSFKSFVKGLNTYEKLGE